MKSFGLAQSRLRGFTASWLVFAAVVSVAGTGAQRAVEPSLPQLLATAGNYIAEYEKAYAAIVSEERYEQTANPKAAQDGPRRRVMRSDLLTYHSDALGWIAFRDVVEVDGSPVGDHTERLLKLVFEPTTQAVDEARRATAESARYNIGYMSRTINVPTIALMFLRRENQARSTFQLGRPRSGPVPLAVVTFKETSEPRLIGTFENTPATGRFWIEPQSGRVVHSELSLSAASYSASVVVDYAEQSKIALWVPVRMAEEYTVIDPVRPPNSTVAERATPAVVNGKAEYQNFRKFETKAGLIKR